MSTSSSSEGGLSDIEQRAQVCRAAICALGTCADRYEMRSSKLLWCLTRRCSEKQADALKALADVLITDHAVSHKLEIIEEAISVYDQVLQFRPLGHERRDEAVSDLGDALCVFCVYNGTDNSRALRSFDLLREAVQLRSENHPLRAQSLHNLARALFVLGYSQRSGDLALLSECIQLNREALQLRTVGHPERIKSLGNLAVALTHYFEYCGDPESIEEGVHMSREVLQLLKPGHPLRDKSVENLAIALRRLAAFLGGLSTLAEAECLLREALALRPSGHPLRFRTLNNLACSLQTRYGLQALPTALSEAIALRREALNLVPASHPEWSVVMKDLANSLVVDFRYRRDLSSITEAITLLRHALPLLRSVGSPGRHHSMITLAEALLAQFDECKDRACLLEATALYHDALDLCPPGHADRAETLHRLGRLLSRPECQSWPKALALFCEAARNCSAGYSARPVLLSDMSKCFLDPASPFFDLGKGISHLSEGYSNELSHVNQRLGQAVSDLQNVETAYMDAMKNADVSIRDQYGSLILDLHAKIIGLLPRAANFGLDHKTRLQVITGSDEISRNAAARAVLLGRLSQAVELLEEGRGIFWSQTLHLRATVFDGIPDKDRENLLRLLRQLEFGTRNTENSDQTVSQREEALERRRQLDEEVQALISKIRAHSGCGRFLMPAAFQKLLCSLPNGFVVILNASKLGHHVLLLHKTAGLATSLELQPPSSGCTWVGLRARLPRDGGTEIGSNSEPYSRAMRKDSGQFSSLEVVLSQLWTFMVQPVISQLGLQVSDVATTNIRA
jgi:tetratricopeptide (TPR) repeat protein